MIVIKLAGETDFDGWRCAARRLATQNVPPAEVCWQIDGAQSGLFDEVQTTGPGGVAEPFSVPRAFVELTKTAILHREPSRHGLLYRLLWRLRTNHLLLEIATDEDVAHAESMAKAVRRDEHKMHAFVRFREVACDGAARFVAWFEPDHHIVERAARFFVERFSNMEWSILTPQRCAHWSEGNLSFTVGVAKSEAPAADRIEEIWRSYYASIFNPTRLKLKAMRTEMPKKYWRNLPEASLIKPLSQMAAHVTEAMIATAPDTSTRVRQRREPASTARPRSGGQLQDMQAEAAACRACPLWKNATQTVFGEGPAGAEIMLVGEQPGDKEDLAGRPFVGPAGQLLDRALKDAGIDRHMTYVTNAVKHFKFVPRGKIRLHQTPATREIRACRQWYEREVAAVRPSLVVALGATAAQSVLGKSVTIKQMRGRIFAAPDGQNVLVTVHPSYLLRLPNEAVRQHEYARLVDDLKIAAAARSASSTLPPSLSAAGSVRSA